MALSTETLSYASSKYYTSQYSGTVPSGAVSRSCFYKPRAVSTVGAGSVAHGSSSTKATSITYRQYLYGSTSVSAYGALSTDRSKGLSGSTSYSVYAYAGTNRTFVGWYNSSTKARYTANGSAASSRAVVIDSSSSSHAWIGGDLESVGITAVFGIKFTVYFRPNGGAGDTSSSYLYCYNEAGEWYVRKAPTNNSLSTVQFTPPVGKSFKGWNTKADGSGTSVDAGSDISTLSSTADAKVYLYAQWIDNADVKVTNGDSGSVTLSIEDAEGESVASETEGVLSASLPPGVQYKITADYDEDLVSGVKVSDEEGTEHSLPYSFTPSAGDEMSLVSSATYVTLYSIRTVFEESKGSVTVSPSPDHEGKWKKQDITFTATPKSGYMATKYKINSGAYKDVPAGGIVVIDGDDVTSDITAYFTFDEAAYEVHSGVESSSRARGSASSSKTGSVAEGETVTFTATAADAMFTFSGWYGKDGTLVSSSNPYTFSATESVSLYARFSVEEGNGTVTVSYYDGSTSMGYISVGSCDNVPGGSGAGLVSLSHTASKGSPVTLSAMVASGCSFVGWYENGSIVSSSTKFETFVKDGRVISAKFSADGGKVYEWEGSSENKTLVWRSKTYVSQKPFNPSSVRVDTLGYEIGSVKVDLFSSPDSAPTAKAELTNVASQTVRRLPIRRMERYLQVEVCNASEVDAIYVGTSAGGLAV